MSTATAGPAAASAADTSENAENMTPAEAVNTRHGHLGLFARKKGDDSSGGSRGSKRPPRRLFDRPRGAADGSGGTATTPGGAAPPGAHTSEQKPRRRMSWFGLPASSAKSKSAVKSSSSVSRGRRMSAPLLFGRSGQKQTKKQQQDKNDKDNGNNAKPRAHSAFGVVGEQAAPTPDPKAELRALLGADEETVHQWSPSESLAGAAADAAAFAAAAAAARQTPASANANGMVGATPVAPAVAATGSASRVPFARVASGKQGSRSRASSSAGRQQREGGKSRSRAPTPIAVMLSAGAAGAAAEGGGGGSTDPAAAKTEDSGCGGEGGEGGGACGLLCPRCKVSMASIPALLLHQGECARRDRTPDLREKLSLQRDQFHLLFAEARNINGQLHEASMAAAVAQDTAAQWREIAAQKEREAAEAKRAGMTEVEVDAPEDDEEEAESATSGDGGGGVGGGWGAGGLNTSDMEIQTEADQAMLELQAQCAQDSAALEAQVRQMDRLTQSLADIQQRHLNVAAQKARAENAFRQEIARLRDDVAAKEIDAQVQRAAATALRRGKAEVEAELAKVMAEADASKQQLLARLEELEAGAGADVAVQFRELQQRHLAHVAAADEAASALEARLASSAAALHESLVAREALATQLEEATAARDRLEASVGQLRAGLALASSVAGVTTPAAAAHSSSNSSSSSGGSSSTPVAGGAGRAQECCDGGADDSQRIHPHGRCAPAPASSAADDEQGTDEAMAAGAGGGGKHDDRDCAQLACGTAAAGSTAGGSEQGAAATPVLPIGHTDMSAAAASAAAAGHLGVAELVQAQRGLMMRVLALSQAPAAEQAAAVAELTRRLGETADVRRALAAGERAAHSLSSKEQEGLAQEHLLKTQLILMAQMAKAPESTASQQGCSGSGGGGGAAAAAAAEAVGGEMPARSHRRRRRRRPSSTSSMPHVPPHVAVDEACQCSIM